MEKRRLLIVEWSPLSNGKKTYYVQHNRIFGCFPWFWNVIRVGSTSLFGRRVAKFSSHYDAVSFMETHITRRITSIFPKK